MPVLVVRRVTYGDPASVIEEAARAPAVPLRRGTSFLVAEVTDGEGIRLHEARRRIVDGRLAVRASTTIDEEGMRSSLDRRPAILEALDEHEKRPELQALTLLFGWAAREVSATERAIERVRTDTFTVASPVLTSD